MKTLYFILTTSILAAIGCTSNNSEQEHTNWNKAEAILQSKSNSGVSGVAKFVEDDDIVSLELNISDATPGSHGVHIHENGDCSSDSANIAGGHWNPTDDLHGEWGSDHHHYGDVGNIEVDSSGKGKLIFYTDKWDLYGDAKFNIIGKSLVIHSGPDYFTSQPSGAAGYKVACGVIKISK